MTVAPNQRFSPVAIDALAIAYNHGATPEELGQAFGVSPQRIRVLLKQSRLYLPRPRHR